MSLHAALRPTGSGTDRRLLGLAIDLSRLSPSSPTRYAVGAVLADAGGAVLATGYTGETDPSVHAEEAALAKLARMARPVVLYASLEPCTVRRSRPTPCTDLIVAAGISRVVFALREPLLFADCHGVETLRRNRIEVVEIADLGKEVREINAHLFARPGGQGEGLAVREYVEAAVMRKHGLDGYPAEDRHGGRYGTADVPLSVPALDTGVLESRAKDDLVEVEDREVLMG